MAIHRSSVLRASSPAGLVLVVLMCIGCGSDDRTRRFMPAPESEMVYEVTVENPFSSPDTITRRGPDPCDTLHHPAFKAASPMSKDMLRGKRYDLQDEISAFAVLDSLRNGSDAATREFYFLVMTRALKWSDGYYS